MGADCNRDGSCLRQLGCVPEFYGSDCGIPCNITCNDDTCDIDDGVCDECRKIPSTTQSPLCRSAGT